MEHLKAERQDVEKKENKMFIDNWLNEHFGIQNQEEARQKSIFIVFDKNANFVKTVTTGYGEEFHYVSPVEDEDTMEYWLRKNKLYAHAADGIGTENIDDLMKIFLSDRKRQRITITDSGEWKNYSADFNASYGWESVLIKMFKILGVYLANGSQLDISIDNDYNGLVIRNGICKQINLKGEEKFL